MAKVEVSVYVEDEHLRKRRGWYASLIGVVGLSGLVAITFLSRPWNFAVGATLLLTGALFFVLERRASKRLAQSRQEVTVAYVETDDPGSLTFEFDEGAVFVVKIKEVIVPAKVQVVTMKVEDV